MSHRGVQVDSHFPTGIAAWYRSREEGGYGPEVGWKLKVDTYLTMRHWPIFIRA